MWFSVVALVGLITYVTMPDNLVFVGELPGCIVMVILLLTLGKRVLFWFANVCLLSANFLGF